MKQFQSRAYVNRLKGHKDILVGLWSEYGLSGGVLYSLSQDGGFRQWSLIEKEIVQKRSLVRPHHPLSRPKKTEEDTTEQTAFLQPDPPDNDDTKENKQNLEQKIILEEVEQEDDNDKDKEKEGDKDKEDEEDEGWTRQDEKQKERSEKITCAAIMSNKTIYCGYEKGMILAWSLKEDVLIDQYEAYSKPVTNLQVLNPRVLVSSSGNTMHCWDTTTGEQEHLLQFPSKVDHIAVHTNILYIVLNHQSILLLSGSDYSLQKEIPFPHFATTLLVQNEVLFIATSDNTIRVYQHKQELSEVSAIPCHQGSIQSLAVVRKDAVYQDSLQLKHYKRLAQIEKYLVAGLDSGDIHIYHEASQQGGHYQLLEIFQGHSDRVSQLVFADSQYLYSGSYDMSIRNWDLREMTVRIRDRYILFREDVQSTQMQAYNLAKAKKKKKKKRKKAKK